MRPIRYLIYEFVAVRFYHVFQRFEWNLSSRSPDWISGTNAIFSSEKCLPCRRIRLHILFLLYSAQRQFSISKKEGFFLYLGIQGRHVPRVYEVEWQKSVFSSKMSRTTHLSQRSFFLFKMYSFTWNNSSPKISLLLQQDKNKRCIVSINTSSKCFNCF